MQEDARPVNLLLLVLALGDFAIGTGSFVFAGVLGGVAGDLSVSVGTAGQLITAYAIVYASPILVTATSNMSRRPFLIYSSIVFVLANAAAVFIPTYWPLMASRAVAACSNPLSSPRASAAASTACATPAR